MDLSTLKSRKLINNLHKFANGGSLLPLSTDLSVRENRTNAVRDLYGPPQDQYNDQQKLQFALSYIDTRNQITNQYTKPSSSDNALGGMGGWFSLALYLGGGALEGSNMYDRKNDIISQAGLSTASSYGVNYQRINDINKLKIMDDYNQRSKESAWTNPMKLATSLDWEDNPTATTVSAILDPGTTVFGYLTGFAGIGARREKEQILKAIQDAYDRNTFREDVAATSGLQLKVAQENEAKFNNQFPMYAKDGKLPKYANGTPVYTPWGPIYGIKPNAMVSSGEEIIVPGDPTSGYVAPGKPNNKDTKPAYLPNEAFVATNKKGISKYLQNTGDIEGAMTMTKLHLMGYKNGKLPRFDDGYISNAILHGTGILASLGLYLRYANLDAYRPNTSVRVDNTDAYRTMAGARYNMFPVYLNTLKLLSHSNNAIDRSGRLSASLKGLYKMANYANAYSALADTSEKYQLANIGLANAAAQAIINGNFAQGQMNLKSRWYDEDYFAKSHGNKVLAEQTFGYQNPYAQALSYIANLNKLNLWSKAMDLYRSNQQLDRDKYDYFLMTGKYPG